MRRVLIQLVNEAVKVGFQSCVELIHRGRLICQENQVDIRRRVERLREATINAGVLREHRRRALQANAAVLGLLVELNVSGLLSTIKKSRVAGESYNFTSPDSLPLHPPR